MTKYMNTEYMGMINYTEMNWIAQYMYNNHYVE